MLTPERLNSKTVVLIFLPGILSMMLATIEGARATTKKAKSGGFNTKIANPIIPNKSFNIIRQIPIKLLRT